MIPTLADLRAAQARIAPHVHRTPVVRARSIDAMAGAEVFFKCENLQGAGAFKLRGATNAILSLDPAAAARGVATHSSGNHGAALALAARRRGIAAHIVVPVNASAPKVAAMRAYGGEVVLCEPTLAARESTLAAIVRDTGASVIHPYDDPFIIAGQASAALELLEEVPELEVIVAPVGGGGLCSGTALAAALISPATRVVGVEPLAADDARRSLAAGRIVPSNDPVTVADGLRTSLGELTFEVLRRHVREIVTAAEDEIAAAMRLFWERTKLVIEPSAAVPVAALLAGRIRARRVGVILSGGNVDLDRLPWQR